MQEKSENLEQYAKMKQNEEEYNMHEIVEEIYQKVLKENKKNKEDTEER